MTADIVSSLLISLVMKIQHKVTDWEEEKPHKSEVADKTDQNGKTAQQQSLLHTCSGHLISCLR